MNVKSSPSIGVPGHPLLPKTVIHASASYWVQALMLLHAEPTLAVENRRISTVSKAAFHASVFDWALTVVRDGSD